MSKTTSIPTEFASEFIPGNVKAAMKDAGASSGDLWRVPFDQIHIVPGLNARPHDEAWEESVESIKRSVMAEGFYPDKPLGVFVDEKGRICVKDGHTRHEGVRRARLEGAEVDILPCVTVPRGTSMADIQIGMVKGNTGTPMPPIGVAVIIKRLIGWGWDEKKIAERLDITEGYVNDLLRLLESPTELQKLVTSGKVAAGTAIKTIKKVGAAEATKQIVEASKNSKDGKVSPKHLKEAPEKAGKTESAAPKAHISAAAAKVPVTEGQMKAALKLVFDDKNFAKLADKVQQKVLEIVG